MYFYNKYLIKLRFVIWNFEHYDKIPFNYWMFFYCFVINELRSKSEMG